MSFEKTDDIYCKKCYDTGIIKIIHHHKDDFKQLMRCSCEKGKLCADALPQWENGLHGAFKIELFDVSWFKPEIKENDNDKNLSGKIMEKVLEWQKIKHKSVNYWAELGFKN